MQQGRRQQQRLLIMQQAVLVWNPIANEQAAMDFIQRGQLVPGGRSPALITPEVQAKIDEIQRTGKVSFPDAEGG